jgi:DNA-directed RNA polymerase subunit RPC12/RpoP
MKAITCTQCGALIKRISLREEFAFCDYCGAKILLEENKEKILEIPDRKMEFAPPNDVPAPNNYGVWIIMLAILLFLLPVILVFIFAGTSRNGSTGFTEKTVAARYSVTPFPTAQPTVYPNINYQVSVTWDGSNDMEHFENPSIDMTKLPTSDEKELKKTVFKNRSVPVKVTIDENGEVTEAKAISGHPILKEAAENAARKTLFANRRKPTTRLLTYIFRLVSE